MREAVDARPVLPVGAVVDDVLADLPVEDLRAAAGQRFETGLDQLVEDLEAERPEIVSKWWISVAVNAFSATSGRASFSALSERG